jgi:myo-inositol-1(or 4)-monophosphatase
MELLSIAEDAAHAAGAVLLERFGGPRREVRSKSTPTDLVSEADIEAERALRGVLADRRPDDAVLGEEGGDRGAGTSGVRWIVDPLDGTVNFLFGIPQWGVSVACADGDGLLAGVVLDPLRDEVFAATRDGPATRDGEPVEASSRGDLATAMVGTGFAYDAEVRAAQAEVAARVLPRVRDLRRMGSAALDLAWTACGRYDAYYERGLQPWDRAAGELLCARAGLELRELPAHGVLPAGLLVAPAALAGPLHELVRP